MSNNPSPLLTPKKIAAYLGVHEMTVYRWAKKGGIIPIFRVGGRWRCRQEDLDSMASKYLGETNE